MRHSHGHIMTYDGMHIMQDKHVLSVWRGSINTYRFNTYRLMLSRDSRAACMPVQDDRTSAFRSTVIYNLGARDDGAAPRWNSRTCIPTLASFAPARALAARRGWQIDLWLYDDGAAGPLEACQGRWRPAVAALAFAPGLVPSEATSVAAFNTYVLPLERAQRTRSKAVTHRRSIVTWAIWKGVLPSTMAQG